MSDVEHVLAVQSELGEGPRWHVGEQALYWVDILGHRVYRYDPASGDLRMTDLGVPVGAVGFRAGGGFVAAVRDGFALWDGESSNLDYIARIKLETPEARLNDAVVDRQGRFWGGTLRDKVNYLYRLDPDHTLHTMESGIALSNGIGWSPDNRTIYFTDSDLHVTFAYDFDPESGAISNRRVFVDTSNEEGVPDGLAVDSEGFVWSARWGGWKIVRYNPRGEVDREVRVPVANPTSCCFGGPDLDELYITTAWEGMSAEERAAQPQAGDLFRVKVGIRGIPEAEYRG